MSGLIVCFEAVLGFAICPCKMEEWDLIAIGGEEVELDVPILPPRLDSLNQTVAPSVYIILLAH